jgi:hypothetical protein
MTVSFTINWGMIVGAIAICLGFIFSSIALKYCFTDSLLGAVFVVLGTILLGGGIIGFLIGIGMAIG